ncbi:hypothetical protein ACTG15_17235 [Aeromonas sp. 164P]
MSGDGGKSLLNQLTTLIAMARGIGIKIGKRLTQRKKGMKGEQMTP